MDELPDISETILLLVPEPVVREHCVLPFAVVDDLLHLYCPDDLVTSVPPEDLLRLIVGRPIRLVPRARQLIRAAIDTYYGESPPPFPGPIVPSIENCEPWFRYECPRKWNSLTPTADARVRHCPECNEHVYQCSSGAELEALRGKRCVFINDLESLGEIGW
jgi:hypothetical protein